MHDTAFSPREPDLFGGFTDVSVWVRGEDKNADVTVFWREFDAKKGLGKRATLTGPAFDPTEACAVAIHRFRELLGDKGRALVWDERTEEWQSTWPRRHLPRHGRDAPRARQVATRRTSAGQDRRTTN